MALHEACGIVGIASDTPVLTLIQVGLRALQHRGQESAGVTIHDGGHQTHRQMGLVSHALERLEARFLQGTVGLGHVRYSTAGDSTLRNAQPITVSSGSGELSIVHNGTIANQNQLREEREAKGWAFLSDTDSEIIVRLLANRLPRLGSPVRAIRSTMERLVGSYSIALLHDGDLYAFRDPLGIKPLCLGRLPGGHVVASESVALDAMGARFVRDVAPGEIVQLTPDGLIPHPGESQARAHCMFEYVYFARADARLDGQLVYNTRWELGRRLWDESPLEADVVVPLPDSGTAFALGYAEASGIPYREGLIKNRFVWRSFIQPHDTKRRATVNEKLNPVPEFLADRRVVLVDDSIVRGNTSHRVVMRVRDAGAKEIHLRIGCPPIVSPCYLGIDMPSREEFIARGRSLEEIARIIGADSVHYISREGLVEAIGAPARELCLGCLTGAYQVPIPGEQERSQATLEEYSES